jgi:hypothetical protein
MKRNSLFVLVLVAILAITLGGCEAIGGNPTPSAQELAATITAMAPTADLLGTIVAMQEDMVTAPAATSVASTPVTTAPTTVNTTPKTGSNLSGNIPGGSWSVSGPPQSVTVRKVAAVGTSDVRKVIPGLENVVADPGVLTTEDCAEADKNISASCSLRTNVQKTFESSPPAYLELPEADPKEGAGSVMVTGGSFELWLTDGTVITVNSEEDVSWIALIRGPNKADGNTPSDGNRSVIVKKFNPGFTMGTILNPGQWISADYIEQQAIAAMAYECGNDGCVGGVGVIAYDTYDETVSVSFFKNGWEAQFTNWN